MNGQTSAGPLHPIREAREAAGLSREGLAFKAGISLSAIERIEGGKHLPRRATLKVIADALGCNPADLMPAEAA